jgi:hypothetical protein
MHASSVPGHCTGAVEDMSARPQAHNRVVCVQSILTDGTLALGDRAEVCCPGLELFGRGSNTDWVFKIEGCKDRSRSGSLEQFHQLKNTLFIFEVVPLNSLGPPIPKKIGTGKEKVRQDRLHFFYFRKNLSIGPRVVIRTTFARYGASRNSSLLRCFSLWASTLSVASSSFPSSCSRYSSYSSL